jgi:GNAT superfamily N-acetyltransferase
VTPARTRVSIRSARPDEGERLREIAEAAKGYWGYDPETVRSWAAAGDFSARGLQQKHFYVAESQGEAIAWAALISRGEVIWLDDMWVDPPWIGKGIGTLLFEHCVGEGRRLGGEQMEWEAEPHAVGFYEKVGGRYLRDSQPSEWGRVLPVMGLEL